MRLSVAFLAVIATITGYAVTNAELPHISPKTAATLTEDISVMGSHVLTRSLKLDNGSDTEKRFLRKHREDEDEADDHIDEEERKGGKNLFAEWKLAEMQNSVKTFKRFANWKAYGLDPTAVFNTMMSKGLYEKYKNLYSMYNRNYATI
ncbi:RxLR effector protein [Phytophthora megakarya]|uniref:RxLR effector protein n=1 Tax=Phytophthora megakarya TaxID=4795 RepID=A0A225VV07_9STRA|nr:RxLR effector protein [Phytophthora megakarya]